MFSLFMIFLSLCRVKMLSKYVVHCIIMTVLVVNVEAQICEKKEIVTRSVNVTYKGTAYVTYLGLTCSYRCVRSRRKVVTKNRVATMTELANVKHCCSGYTRVDTYTNDSSIECQPICMPSCKNGFCESPAKCSCHPGYEPDPEDSHNCLPVCNKPCTNGVCVAPNTCQCNFGYASVNGSCQPICTEPCHNGTCVSPETCECHAGYRKSEQNTCQPYCLNGCENGACIAPEECSCNPGYRLTESTGLPNKSCKPVCSNNCTNGDCIAPEKCQCWPSYKISESFFCEPVCEKGWILKDHKCVAECQHSCGNGTCMSPNVCVCYAGYHIDFERLLSSGKIDAALCVPTCTNCNGICVAPNVCVREQSTTTECAGLCTEQQTTPATIENMNVTLELDYDLLYNVTLETGNYSYNDEPISKVQNNESVRDDDMKSAAASSWIASHWVPVFVPIICIAAAAILVFVVYRYTPVLVFFKGKSYVVKNGPRETGDVDEYSFEDVRIRFSNDKKT